MEESFMKKKYIYLCVVLTVVLGTSCERFLDINPKGALEQDKMFADVQGYRDAMYGVYATMASEDLYGRNLSWGFMDVAGQMFLYDNANELDPYIASFDYRNMSVQTNIYTIWAQMYTCISYVNNIIENVEKTSLTGEDLKLVKGEAYGLRAYMHFDILRLFADDYMRSTSRNGIPYSLHYDLKNKDIYDLDKAYGQVLDDLNRAEELLADDNYIWTVNPGQASVYATKRYEHMNKYAVYALKARVYHAMGDYQQAVHYARLVIDNTDNFHLSSPTADAFSKVSSFPAPNEMIFGLYNSSIVERMKTRFIPTTDRDVVSYAVGRRDIDDLYETGSFATYKDLRHSSFYSKSGQENVFQRFTSNVSGVKDLGLFMIRLPEMYYILAEALYDTDKQAAIAALNKVRVSRGLSPELESTKTASREQFNAELIKERMREMPGEGQVFFAYKHFNRLPGQTVLDKILPQPINAVFTLPWPELELEFGNKN